MSTDVPLPRLGSTTMSSAVIVSWLVAEGEDIAADQPLVEIETDESTVEIASPVAGVVQELLASEQEEVPVGAVIARIGTGVTPATGRRPSPPERLRARRSVAAAESPAGSLAESPPESPPESLAEPPAATPGGSPDALRAAPAARRRARELGVDLRSVAGTGPSGRIQSRDVEAAAVTPAESPPPLRGLRGARRVGAERLARSSAETAPVTLTRQVAAGRAVDLVGRLRTLAATEDTAPGLTDLIVAAVARSLAARPDLNVALAGDGLIQHGDVHVGFAVHTPRGLLVPVLRDADRADLGQLAAQRRRLTRTALAGRLQPADMVDGRCTVTNLGAFGVDAFTPIINLPETMILGVGRARDTVVARDGQAVVTTTMWMSLTFDHRLVDGVPAAQYLDAVTRLIEEPLDLVLPPDPGPEPSGGAL